MLKPFGVTLNVIKLLIFLTVWLPKIGITNCI
jgi:hypothetical protein